jgi:hypothetical protein
MSIEIEPTDELTPQIDVGHATPSVGKVNRVGYNHPPPLILDEREDKRDSKVTFFRNGSLIIGVEKGDRENCDILANAWRHDSDSQTGPIRSDVKSNPTSAMIVPLGLDSCRITGRLVTVEL